MRLSDLCRLDGCEKRKAPNQAFMIGPERFDFCSEEHLRAKLAELSQREKVARMQ